VGANDGATIAAISERFGYATVERPSVSAHA
jgi:hypothetical protein